MASPEENPSTLTANYHALDRFSNDWYDRGAPRLKEILWRVISFLWFQGHLPLPSAWRVFWLRQFGAKVGRGVVIRSKVMISMPWRLTLGDHVWIGEEAFILTLAEVSIGSHTCVSQRAFLCTGGHDVRSPDFKLTTKPIRIGEQAWVGAQAFVGGGVEIGDGTVIGAGSVVMKSVPGGVIVGGNPAQVLKKRDAH